MLHEVVHEVVSNPALLAEIGRNESLLAERYALEEAERKVLLAIIQNPDFLATLLDGAYAPETPHAQAWIP